MGISKDLSQTPYFDDYNEDKNFHRVLFKPSTAVQARELNQMQTVLQDQIERFGENILVEGTIVSGGNFKELNPLPYVKVLDNDTDNRPIVLSNYLNLNLRGKTSGVTARVVTSESGFQSQTNKNTLYIKYTSANATSDQSTFDSAEQIEVLNNDGTIAVTLTVAGTRDSAPVGDAYGITCGDGVLFQKGHFIRFYEQIKIVSRYGTVPNNVIVGFNISETVVDSFQDTSLLDNASGFNNEQAPGADRLKLTPILTVLDVSASVSQDNFFIIQEYQNGNIVRRNDRTKFNSIGAEMSRRTVEESGNYALNPHKISISEDTSNTSLVTLSVGPGISYVEGNRVEVLADYKISLPKSTETFSVDQQNVTTAYGNYYNVSSITGTFPVQTLGKVELVNNSAAVVGTARIRAVRGTSATSWRLYLFDVEGDSVSSAYSIRSVADNNITATITLDGNSNPERIQSSDNKSAIFTLGKGNIESLTGTPDYSTSVQSTFTVGSSSPYTGSLTRNSDWYWRDTAVDSIAELDYIVLRANGTVVPSANFSIETVGSDDTADRNFVIDDAYAANGETYSVILPVKRKVVASTKDLQTVYIRVNANTHSDLASGNYSLGLPDVLEIVNIWKHPSGANTTFTEAEASSNTSIVSVKNQYALNPNQKDSYYDYSFIKKKSAATLAAGETLLIKANVFKIASSSTSGYFAVNSYPVDDSASPAANTIKTEGIPSFSSDNGVRYNLRDSIDFRPYPTSVTYNTTSATASVVNDSLETLRSNITFGTSTLYYPISGGQFETDFDYYVGRIDKVYFGSDGNLELIEGSYADTPQPPTDPLTGMVVAQVTMTPFPSLPSSVANKTGHPEYSVVFNKPNNRRYTMKDIGKIDQRVKQLEYYTVLNALEKDAEDYVIQDGAGLNRFKNGIFVDNFKNLLNADLLDPSFSASVSKTQKELAPRVHQYYLDTKVADIANVTRHKDVITLPFGEESIITQPFATATKSCTTDFYRFAGTMRIYPEYDGGADTTIAPDIQMPDNGIVEAFTGFTAALGELAMFQDSIAVLSSRVQQLNLGSSTSGNTRTTNFVNETTTVTQLTTQNMDVSETGDVTSVVVGDFITDASFAPFLRSQDVEIEIFGMMPGKRVYFYFDGEAVNAHIAKATLLTVDQLQENESAGNQRRLHQNGKFDAANIIRADATGVVRAIFRIPEGVFYVGDRILEVTSAIQHQDIPNSITYAARTYRGFNFSASKASLVSSTREPVFNFSTAQTTSTTVTRGAQFSTSVNIGGGGGGASSSGGGGSDPIAQTFWIDQASTTDSVLQVSAIDVFFSSKSTAGNGVTAQIYETINGYPSDISVPFGAARLESSQVNVDAGTTGDPLAASTFTFNNPVTLNVNREYCVIIQPDGNDPDYRVWIAKTGQNDVVTGVAVTQNVSSGVLFTSTNKRAWTPYQDENLTFKLRKALYTAQTGTVDLVNRDHDFLDISSYSGGTFSKGEKVFKSTSESARTFASDTISFTDTSRTVTCATASTFTNINNGDQIVVDYGNAADPRYQSFTVESKGTPASGGEITLREPAYNSSSDATFYKTVVGTMDYFYESPIDFLIRMIVVDSTAVGTSVDDGDKFKAGDTLIGVDSTATATVSQVTDLPINTLNMNVYKTDYSRTRTDLAFYKTSTVTESIEPGASLHLNKANYSIKSMSNRTALDIPFKLRATLRNVVGSGESVDSSPILDHESTNAHLVEYVINNDLTGEVGNLGNASSKYITKIITLADQMDSTDLSVLLTAYRPVGTDISVYGKFINGADLRAFNTIEWSPLSKIDTTDVTSTSTNRYDFKEIEYRLPQGSAVDGEGAVRVDQDTMNYIVGGSTFTSYKYFAIKVVLTSSQQYSIPRVKDLRAIALA